MIRVDCILDISQAVVLFIHASWGHTVLGVMNIAAKEAGHEGIQSKDVT